MIIPALLKNKELFPPLQCKLKQNFFLVSVKLIEYFFPAVNVVSSNLFVAPSHRIKTSLFFLSTCIKELLSTTKIITLQPNPPVGNRKLSGLSNPMPYLKYLYLSISAFSVN